MASKKEAEIKAIRARYGKGGIPRGSSDAATVDQMEFDLERMKKSLGKWDEKIKVAESKTTPQTSNDAIAPSEIYLSAYNETRNKYRRSS